MAATAAENSLVLAIAIAVPGAGAVGVVVVLTPGVIALRGRVSVLSRPAYRPGLTTPES